VSVELQVVEEEELKREGSEEEIEIEMPIMEPKEIKKAVMLGEGDCFEAMVEKIELGTLGMFIPNPPEKFRENWEQRRHKLAYRFKIVVPDYGLEAYDIITVSAQPNSRMAQLRICYGEIGVGGKVYVCVKNGRLRISCPPPKREAEVVKGGSG